MILQPGERRISQRMNDHANKEKDECKALWAEMQSDGILLPSRSFLAEAWEHAMNKRYGVDIALVCPLCTFFVGTVDIIYIYEIFVSICCIEASLSLGYLNHIWAEAMAFM
jgi:hypothetical protein